MKYNSYYLYQKYCNIGGQGMIPVYPNVYSNDADGTQSKRLHVSGDTCCTDIPAKHRTTSGSPYCDNSYNKCIDVYDQISYDDGETWETTATTTTVLEYESEYCRAFRWINMDINTDYWCDACSGATPEPQYKVSGYTSGDTTYITECSSSSMLTKNDVPRSAISVVIGKCVDSISSEAFVEWFSRKEMINEVYIPSTVTSIPTCCFSGRTSIVSITLPETITSIGASAFTNCLQLTNLDLWDNITSIGEWAFNNCDSLTSIHIPTSLTTIPPYCFASCGALSILDIPDNIITIGSFAFTNSGINILTIGSGVTSIGERAFSGCSEMTSVSIGDSVSIFGSYPFYGCTKLPVDGNIRYADTYLIETTDKTLSGYTIKSGTKWIGENAFSFCTYLTNITLPDSLINIKDFAFSDCYRLTNINIPDSVTSIGDYVFRSCESLSSVTIGSGVTEIGDKTFIECDSLPVEDYRGDLAYIRYADTFLVKAFYDPLAPVSRPTSWVVKNGTKWIGSSAFTTTYDIMKNVTIPNSVVRIGENAFRNCSGLTSVTIPNSVTSIGVSAFTNCIALSSATISNSITKIEERTFYNCNSLNSVDIPNSVKTIGSYAFYNCSGLTSCTIGSGAIYIDSYAFENCSGLTSITINAVTPPNRGYLVFGNTNDCPIYVPSSSVTEYKTKWSEYSSRIYAITI